MMTDLNIVNFPYLNNILESTAYGVFVSSVCLNYEDVLFRGSIQVSKLLRRDIFHGNFQTMAVIQILFTNFTPLRVT